MGVNTSTSQEKEKEKEKEKQLARLQSSSSLTQYSDALAYPEYFLEPRGSSSSSGGAGISMSSSGKDKKKKSAGFATLRKKFIRRRKSSKYDHARIIRDLVSGWSMRDLNALVEEYEATNVLKELTIHANLARPHASCLKEDLSDLYDYKYCTDIDLIFLGTCFPVHRGILSLRCPYFRDLLRRHPQYGAQVHVDIRTKGMDISTFSALLRYLYTGDFNTQVSRLENLDVLVKLGDQFGTPNLLEHDFRHLLETGEFCDAVLVFSSEPAAEVQGQEAASIGAIYEELFCHKSILAARSPFFRNLLHRRCRSGEELTERTLQQPTRIVLDESIIPKRYARVLLHAIYLDVVDLSFVIQDSPSMGSLGEVQAMVSGRGQLTRTEEAMEVYQIARFLDLTIMAQACEDIIAESLCQDNLITILNWSSQAHGSQWVNRQAMHFLREEFLAIATSPVLCELNKGYLIEGLKSDYLQVRNKNTCWYLLKWAEHQLIKRIEEREPNLLSNTQHSVSKKGIKRRDLDDSELREILSDILPYIRVDHIIPHSNEVLTNVIRRGLISTPPSHMFGSDDESLVINPWIRCKNNPMYVKPRLFTPYMDEVKAILDEHMVAEMELVRLRMIRMSHIPDTLYMVDAKSYQSRGYTQVDAVTDPSVIAGSLPAPDVHTTRAIMEREKELCRSNLTQRAFSLPCSDIGAVIHEIQKRVVREFGLPDEAVEIFKSGGEDASTDPTNDYYSHSRRNVEQEWCGHPETPVLANPPDSPVAAAAAQVVPMLSEMMPDIAMATGPDITIATAPSINQMLLREPELGDEHFVRDKNGQMGEL
uniref:BTB/POZ domain-containing protein 7-like n=1 Tax=Saccoglossus kowalevskii TaxID=10224 RepID=A0ABM0M658_SACKO|nr:PREDICTED: BTB/POZ domain-containing protein 7-like [Saccoglossus kowalevskii]